jgi:hypothetical protein
MGFSEKLSQKPHIPIELSAYSLLGGSCDAPVFVNNAPDVFDHSLFAHACANYHTPKINQQKAGHEI